MTFSLSDHCLITFNLLYHRRKSYNDNMVRLSNTNKWTLRREIAMFSEIVIDKIDNGMEADQVTLEYILIT